jgi:hypothetical protein
MLWVRSVISTRIRRAGGKSRPVVAKGGGSGRLLCSWCIVSTAQVFYREAGPAAYANQPDYIVCEDGKAIGRMYEDRQTLPELRWFWSITVYVDPKRGINTSGRVQHSEQQGQLRSCRGSGLTRIRCTASDSN